MNNELEKRFPFKETEESLILNWKNDEVFKFKNSQHLEHPKVQRVFQISGQCYIGRRVGFRNWLFLLDILSIAPYD